MQVISKYIINGIVYEIFEASGRFYVWIAGKPTIMGYKTRADAQEYILTLLAE